MVLSKVNDVLLVGSVIDAHACSHTKKSPVTRIKVKSQLSEKLTYFPKTGPFEVRIFSYNDLAVLLGFTMKQSRFSEQQIAFILKQVDDGISVNEVCRKAGISQQTYYR